QRQRQLTRSYRSTLLASACLIIVSAAACSRYPCFTRVLAAAFNAWTYPSWVWYRSSSDSRGSPPARRSAFVVANGMKPPTGDAKRHICPLNTPDDITFQPV